VSGTAEHDPDAGREPAFRPPAGACDAHFHVFGPAEHYPYAGELRYRPPYAPLDAYMALARRIGFERFVFVQPSAYGLDNSCMLDAMRQIGTGRCRGIVDMDETVTSRETMREWHRLGVRGVRVNVSPIQPVTPGLADKMRPRIRRLGALMQEFGWHLDFLTPGWLIRELLPDLRALPIDFSVAHLGLFPAKDGPDQPGFLEFLDLVRGGRCWVKLTGIYRMSTTAEFADVAPMARALIATAPNRIIWGSDYPHLSFHDKVGSIQLFNMLAQWAPDEATRRRILVDNPQALFGFDG
jgi:predicted TIM-barrel fold metal-dependent hydrolase